MAPIPSELTGLWVKLRLKPSTRRSTPAAYVRFQMFDSHAFKGALLCTARQNRHVQHTYATAATPVFSALWSDK